MAEGKKSENEVEVKAFKALPRDPSQPEHRKPRVFIHRPDETPEEAEISRREASYFQAAKTIKAEDFTKVAQQPCVRNALLPAIGGGFGVGALRFVIGGSVMAACNWASGSFVGVSIIAYNYCQRQRYRAKENIRQAVKVLDAKEAMKLAQQAKNKAVPAGSLVSTGPHDTESTNESKSGVSFWSSFRFW